MILNQKQTTLAYRCPHCGKEGFMEGKGTTLTCHNCNKVYELTPQGALRSTDGDSKFTLVSQWSQWQRQQIRQEILDGTYKLDIDVDIAMIVDHKAIYRVGTGHLVHDLTGFHLTGCDGALEYHQAPQNCYGLYADYYWYEIGDMIGIGNNEVRYHCFPRSVDVVAKTRTATEEMYKLYKSRQLKMPHAVEA